MTETDMSWSQVRPSQTSQGSPVVVDEGDSVVPWLVSIKQERVVFDPSVFNVIEWTTKGAK